MPRLIPLYKAADWDQLRRAMTDLADRMEPLKDSATYEKKCGPCSETLFVQQSVTATHTSRLGSGRVSLGSHPLFIRRFIKRRDHVFTKMRMQGTEELKVLCKQLQTEVQRQLQRAYWAYLNTTFEDADTEQATTNKCWLEPSQADAEILPDTTPLLLELQLSPTLMSSLAVTSTSPAGIGN